MTRMLTATTTIQDIEANTPFKVATRGAMAALTGMAAGTVRYVGEAGREGFFIWTTGNQSAKVTADPQQGLYVAPASDTTGASGVWVRKFTGPYVSLWWGVATGNTAAQNVTAFRAALTTLAFLKLTSFGYVDGTAPLYTPAGHYLFNDQLKPESGVDIYGDTTLLGNGTIFEWTASSGHGIYIQGWDGSSRHGTGSQVRKLHLKGWYSGTRSSQHAVYVNGQSIIEDLFCENWPGIAVNGFGDTGGPNGNINVSTFRNIYAQNCDLTLRLQGGDSNACLVEHIQGQGNRLGVYWDWSFLGNSAFAIYAENNGLDTNFRSRCEKSGHIYVVAYGQETWCSTNSPSGTTASNTGWLYLMDGSTNFYTATWVTGQTWYFTSPISIGPPDNGNTLGRADSCYIESGQNPLILGINATCTATAGGVFWTQQGLLHGGNSRGSGVAMLFNNGINVPGTVTTSGANHEIGPEAGVAADLFVNLHCTNFTTQISATRWAAGVPTSMGSLLWFNGTAFYDGVFGHNFRYNGTTKLTITTNGLTYASGSNPTLTEVTAASIPTPAAGTQTLFIDSADHKLKRKDSSAVVTIIN